MRHPSLLILAALLSFGATRPVHAVGRLVDVQVVDRATGETLTPILHRGEWWIAGRPGARYGIVLRAAGQRTLGVLSVDGVNAISGDTAAWEQTGYVLRPHRRVQIDGWRKNMGQIAAFEFTALPDSYAARTGRPANVGVIGVAMFLEGPDPVVVESLRGASADDDRRERPRVAAAPSSSPSLAAPAPSSSDPPAPPPGTKSSVATPPVADAVAKPGRAEERAEQSAAPASIARADRLGTGHGAIEESRIGRTTFQRAQSTPNEVVTIHYDRLENLIAMGIVPPPIAADPFPGSGRFVADPPPR